MLLYRRRVRGFALCLAALAGYVDALGFLKIGGFFVSFMSGNSTRLGIRLGDGPVEVALPLALIATFVLGVMVGSLVSQKTRKRGSAVLLLVTALLCACAIISLFTQSPWIAILLAMAMGAENAIFERNGEVSVGVTYMTGTLVKLGQHLTQAFTGGSRFAWVWYFMLWLSLIAGAVCGTLAFHALDMNGLWIAVAAAGVLAAIARGLPFEDNQARI